jgi:diacylglycerol O-acyltransferase
MTLWHRRPHRLGDKMSSVQFRSMMSSSDAIIWNIEKDPEFRSTLMAVWILDTEPTDARMHESIERMVNAIPRLRQIVVPARPRPRWQDIDHVDTDQHFSTQDLGGSGELADVLSITSNWVNQPFDKTRPLWQLGLVKGLADGKAAIIIKVHHSIADGIGLVLMLAAFTDLERDPTTTPIAPHNDVERPRYTWPRRIAERSKLIGSAIIRHPIASAKTTRRMVPSVARLVWPNRQPLSKLMTERSGTVEFNARTVPFADFKAAGRIGSASINDAFVAVVADAFARYHREIGIECDRLRIHMPVNIRNERTADVAGNQFVPARWVLDAPHGTPIEQLGIISAQLTHMRSEPALPHVNGISAAVQLLGKRISRFIIGGMMKGVDALASNVPGPPFPLYIGGAKVEQFFAFGPPAGAALNVTLFTYDGTVWLGVTTDTAAVTDPERFGTCLDAAIEHLMSAGEIPEDDCGINTPELEPVG